MTTNEPVADNDKPRSSGPRPFENKPSVSAENAGARQPGLGDSAKQVARAHDDTSVNLSANEALTANNADSQHESHDEAPNTAYVHPVEGVSQWSHQALAPKKSEHERIVNEDEWQDMPAYAPYDLYDDDNKLVAREAQDLDDDNPYEGLGGAGKGYTRVQVDEDARSATSMDDNTSYLFKHKTTDMADDEEEQRDPLAQMQATKILLTEGQRIAYVGVTRLAMLSMVKELNDMEGTKATKKELRVASESMQMWSQQMMVRLFAHMEIDSSGTV